MVEKRLANICLKIKETEVKIGFFRHMVRDGVATADVRSFVEKQAKLKRVDQNVHAPTVRQAMKSKLIDTIASLELLKKSKRDLVDSLCSEFSFPKSKCRNLIRSYMRDATVHKERHNERLSKKFKHCKKKMKINHDIVEKQMIDCLPSEVKEIASGVNIFQNDLLPERSADPMICDKSIKLSKSELAFLRKGPRFMARQAITENDFCTELNKMIVKDKYEQADDIDLDNSDATEDESN